ncbi:MAG TPA: N4-gp56 family major capsid protein [Noviherbaspirillum sp.]|nr:N4-gp56 family major capsid protein [Noviherbaspirillum sp.]
MSATVVAFGDPRAIKKWSANLWVDVMKTSYFEKFTGKDDNSIIQRKPELEGDAGDRVSFDLCVRLRNEPTYGDDRVEGSEESLRFFTDEVKIDQVRKAVSAGGAMTRKRTAHDLRTTAKNRLSEYFAQLSDEFAFMYLSGARGINEDYLVAPGWTGYASNTLDAPDADHIMFGGAATSKASLAATDTMSKDLIERALNKAAMMQARNPQTANMVPVSVDGQKAFVLLMNPDQEYDLRKESGANGWVDIQKALATNLGNKSPIVQGGLGMIGGAILHSHRNVIRFNDYGAGGNVYAARALLLGRQAGVVAYGNSGGARFQWKEEEKDYGNEPVVSSGFIGGFKKTRFNGKDFGVISIDTAAKDPNA